jgi:hypothetical protein
MRSAMGVRRRLTKEDGGAKLYSLSNLFTLWFNLHQFERGSRKGKSSYENDVVAALFGQRVNADALSVRNKLPCVIRHCNDAAM